MRLRFFWEKILKPVFKNPPGLIKKDLFKDESFMEWSIYGGLNVRVKDWARRFRRVHCRFKYRFLIPLMYLGELILGKKVLQKPGIDWHDRNFRAFEKAWNQSIWDWQSKYMNRIMKNVSGKTRQQIVEEIKGSESIQILEKLKKFLMVMVLEDTAYRELFNILLYNITIEMNKEHKRKKIHHLFHTGIQLSNVNYYTLGKSMTENKVFLVLLDKLTNKQNKKNKGVKK